MLSTLIDPWILYPVMAALKGPRYPLSWRNYRHTVGVMIKVTDEVSGTISVEGRISKPMTSRDRDRLHHASVVSRQILVKAGCDPESIFVSRLRGTHPSAPCASARWWTRTSRRRSRTSTSATPASSRRP